MNINVDKKIEGIVTIRQAIKQLQEELRVLCEDLPPGRLEGTDLDLYNPGEKSVITYSVKRLKQLVDERTLARCRSVKWRKGSVQVVPKKKTRKKS